MKLVGDGTKDYGYQLELDIDEVLELVEPTEYDDKSKAVIRNQKTLAKIKCVRNTKPDVHFTCSRCFFNENFMCKHLVCNEEDRHDGKEVYFIDVTKESK